MEFTLESALSPQGMIGHAAYLLLVASMLMRRMLYLRLLVIASALVAICYTGFILHDPVSTFWETLLITTNIGQILYSWHLDRRVRFTAEEQALCGQGLPGLPPSLCRAFLDKGRWLDMPPGTVMAREGEAVGALHWLAQGRARIEVGGTTVASVAAGEFIGESAVFGGPASATVTAASPVRAWSVEAGVLAGLLDRSPAVAHALQRGLAHDARAKLLRANHSMGRAGRGSGSPALTLQALPASP